MTVHRFFPTALLDIQMSTPSVVKAIAVLKAGSIEGTVRFEQEVRRSLSCPSSSPCSFSPALTYSHALLRPLAQVKGGPTKITASVKGVTGKKYTLHIHQFGDLTADSATGMPFAHVYTCPPCGIASVCADLARRLIPFACVLSMSTPLSSPRSPPLTAGGFFNPLGSDASRKHADDIGELKSSASAGADASWSLSDSNRLVSLIGPTSIIGRSIVLHEDENDAKQGGKRVASAVIGIAA